jgi:hypothetical protein
MPIVRPLLLAAATLVALALTEAQATIYKCLQDDGGVFYQDEPCRPGRELRDFDKDPANVSVMPFDVPPPAPAAGAKSAKSRTSNEGGSQRGSATRVPRPESKPVKKMAERGDPTQRKFLRPGMSEGEVIARVGPPDMTSSGGTRKGTRWTYMPVAEDAHTITNLQLDGGRVVEVERKVLR